MGFLVYYTAICMLLAWPHAAGACRPGLHRWEALGVEAPYPLFAGTLVVSAGSALWGAVLSRQRRDAPGSGPLMWLMLAIAHWCLTSALHTLTPEMAVRVFWAKVHLCGQKTQMSLFPFIYGSPHLGFSS